VKQAVEFYRHAQDCRVMAGKQKNKKLRCMLLTLASQWEELAKARDGFAGDHAAPPDCRQN
jgi:hypothetical protein